MTTHEKKTSDAGTASTAAISLHISNVTPVSEGEAAVDFTLSAEAPGMSHGYTLWSEDAEGTLFRHSATKAYAELHRLPFGTFPWWAPARLHTATHMRFFAALEWENPTRISDYVDVILPPVPAPTEFAARDGGLKVVGTGRARPRSKVLFSVAGQSTIVEVRVDGRWQVVMDAPEGRHKATAVSLGGGLPDSASVSTSVVVAPAPDIPLLLLFPEVGRKITRLTRVTGTARPRSKVEASLGGGPVVSTEANPGGAWEMPEVRSDASGEVTLFVESSTGEAAQRTVNVEYFPQWEVTQLVAGRFLAEDGTEIGTGIMAKGSGDPGDVIQYRTRSNDDWTDLATVDEERAWRFDHLTIPPHPPFQRGRLFLRTPGDPEERVYIVEPPPPIISTPRDGYTTGANPEFSGFATNVFTLQLPDGTKQRIRPENDRSWRAILGPFAPGIHTVIAYSTPDAGREVSQCTFVVVEESAHGTHAP